MAFKSFKKTQIKIKQTSPLQLITSNIQTKFKMPSSIETKKLIPDICLIEVKKMSLFLSSHT